MDSAISCPRLTSSAARKVFIIWGCLILESSLFRLSWCPFCLSWCPLRSQKIRTEPGMGVEWSLLEALSHLHPQDPLLGFIPGDLLSSRMAEVSLVPALAW